MCSSSADEYKVLKEEVLVVGSGNLGSLEWCLL